ncbi:sulfite exporter TauE/SafE family protein [Amphritea opalescens]|uniref:Probable membrane transporter protein n=1 Tax=Amphritea opalescens TaxID=2490544 RepID=A0A430KQ27_9GAMM|nr:sulfite exporter TauE/SafE family protein [Amphritea opalescens]RTE65565.1 sulfite exporter TauE/SafE family protein [Amphritea opalescens]
MEQILSFSAAFWILAVLGVLVTGISKSGFAGGVGVISVPLMSLYIGPVQAAAIMLPLLILMDFFSVRAWWSHRRVDLLKIMLPAAILGIIIGYLLFGYLNDDVLRLLLGILSISFGLWGLLKGSRFGGSSPIIGYITSTLAGFTSFVAHAGGPPMNFYLLPMKLPREQFLGTAVVFLASVNFVKLFAYGALGQINTDNLLVGLVLAPVAWIGTRLGLVIHKKLDDQLFYRIILVMLVIIGVKLVFDGL